MSTIVDAPLNKVLRRYAITPGTVQGRKMAEPIEVVLRYGEIDILSLPRDCKAAHDEVIAFAHKRNLLPRSIVTADAVCVRETLRRA